MEAALESILINTYNPSHDLRLQAEQALQSFLATPGSMTALITFIGNIAVHRELRQATGLIIKNRLRDFWNNSEGKGLPATLDEKELLKLQIVNILLVETDNSIRGILAESIRVVSEYEFPNNWPSLVPTLIANIETTEVLKIYNSLLALRKLVKRFEYKQKDERRPLNEILQLAFPKLQTLMSHILLNNSLEAAQVMRLCLKIFWSATIYVLPAVSGVDVNLWFNIVSEILNKRLPEAHEGLEPLHQPIDPDERKVWPWWKLKKWAARIMTHFIQRYGNPRYCSEEDKPFAEYFRSNTAIVLLTPAMNNLQMKSQGVFITDDVYRSCLTYVANCTEMSPTYKVLKPHLHYILFDVVFPTLCMTQEDVQLFSDDPVEFIRKIHDPANDWLSPMLAATNLLQMLARYRQKDVMPMFIPFLQSILKEYLDTPMESRNFLKKDGALVSIATLSKIILDSKTYSNMLVPLLAIHILPEFESPAPFLRARACWVIEYLSDIDWSAEATPAANKLPITKRKLKGKKNQSQPGEGTQMTAGQILQAVLQGLIKCLRDPALPVQAAAACSLRVLISQDGATDLLRPLLPQIVAEYFRIMEEVENESVLSALQAIVMQYGEEIADIAPMMVDHLVKNFNEYSQEAEEEEAAFNAVQCLDTIDSILDAVQEREDTLLLIEPKLLPMFLHILNQSGDCFEYIDTAVHMISGFTYYYDSISPSMWHVCGPLLHALNDWAIDFVSEFMVPILNFMTKGINIFLDSNYLGQPFVVTLLESIVKTFNNEEGYSGRDISSAATMLSCLVISSKQTVDKLHPLLPQILALTFQRLQTIKSTSAKIRLLEIFMAALYYDASYTLSIIQKENPDVLKSLFTMLFDTLKVMERDFTQRLIVLSFTALLTLPQSSLPEILIVNSFSMFQQIIRELVLIEEEGKKDHNDSDGSEGDSRYDDDDFGIEVDADEDDFDEADDVKAAVSRAKKLYVPDGGYNEDEDCLNAEDEDYRQMLEQMGSEEKGKKDLYMSGEPVDDEDEDEDFAYTSPIESYPLPQMFYDAFSALATRDADFVISLRNQLQSEDAKRLEELIISCRK